MNPNRSLIILLVDNDPTEREIIRQNLLQASICQFNVVEAVSGEAGLKWCSRQQPDAILLASLLPDMTILEFLRTLSEQANGRITPVVLLKKPNDESLVLQAISAGAQGYIDTRNLTSEELALVIQVAILLRS